jgi:hypothetical protein
MPFDIHELHWPEASPISRGRSRHMCERYNRHTKNPAAANRAGQVDLVTRWRAGMM